MTVRQTLRSRLRDSLRAEHEALDERVSGQDLQSLAGFTAFLRMNEAGYGDLSNYAARPEVTAALRDLCQRARDDLAALGAAPLPRRVWSGPAPAALAIEYVVAGSRLGGEVLRRQWENGPLAARGSSYMSAPNYLELWRAFIAATADLPGDDASADAVVADARRVFQMFNDLAAVSLKGVCDLESA